MRSYFEEGGGRGGPDRIRNDGDHAGRVAGGESSGNGHAAGGDDGAVAAEGAAGIDDDGVGIELAVDGEQTRINRRGAADHNGVLDIKFARAGFVEVARGGKGAARDERGAIDNIEDAAGDIQRGVLLDYEVPAV